MAKITKHVFNGTAYKVAGHETVQGRDLGECDFNNKVIRVPIDGDTLAELDVLIHEPLHACFPYIAEFEINKAAQSIARFLWRLDWRKDDESK